MKQINSFDYFHIDIRLYVWFYIKNNGKLLILNSLD